jgi:RHS repeat-associated protein
LTGIVCATRAFDTEVWHMWRYGCGVVLCGALIGGLATPAFAADGPAGDPGSVFVGGFSVGDGLEAMIDEREGSLRFQVPVGGLSASWDSRRAGVDRSGLGPGWDWAIGSVDTQGGVRVFPASGGVYEADASVTSGLRGYGVGDIRFEQREGVLPAREGVVEGRPFSYVLTELGGVTTYFSAAGDPLAKIEVSGRSTEWLWSDGATHRLVGVVDAYGVRTDLIWDDTEHSLVVRPATNAGGTPAHEWRLELTPAGVASVTDPLGQATTYAYADAGLVSSISGASGAATSVSWQPAVDGITRVDELTTADAEGEVLSARSWASSGASAPTGWPASAQPGGAEFETVLADGASRVVSTYSAAALLTHRELHVSTAAGSAIVHEVEYTYPDTKGVDPAQLPGNWSRPSATEITYADASGASRSIAESSVFDETGRAIERTAADGSVTRTEYDPTLVGDAGVPSGLVVREVVETPDGLRRERVNTLNDEHSAVVGTEVRESRAGGEAAVIERTEFEVDDDGFVREQRDFPQGEASAPPVITRWDEQVALADGMVTRAETVAVGTAAEATTTQVSSLVHGAALEAFDALGNRSVAEYDALGRPVSMTDAAGRTTATTYRVGEGDRTVTTTTPDGVQRTEVHDALGRLVEVTDNIATVDGGPAVPVSGHVRRVESREYDPGRVTVTDAWGATSSTTQDVFGRTIALQAATGLVEVTEYDDTTGTARQGVTPTGDLADAAAVQERRRDAAGNVVSATDTRADEAVATDGSSQYDGFGRVTFTTDGSTESRVEYDALGRAAVTTLTVPGRSPSARDSAAEAVADATAAAGARIAPGAGAAAGAGVAADAGVADVASLTASIEFDAFGRSTGKTLSDGRDTRAGYIRVLDELGRMVEETDQSGASTRYGHTVDGQVAWSETSAGQRTEVEYDPVTRARLLVRVSSPGAAEVATAYGYDEVTGRLAWVADAADAERTRIAYEYDAFGNVARVSYPDGREVLARFDEHGRKTALTDVAGNRTDLSYTEAGVLVSAVQTDEAGVELARVAYTYDELGRVSAFDRGNGLVTEYTYTAADELATERTMKAGRVLDERTYTYDASGDLTRRVDTTRDGVAEAPVTTATEYVYDAFHRLVGSTVRAGDSPDSAITRTIEYEVTLAGDVAAETVRTDIGSATETATTRTFGYSARGELHTIATETADGTSVAAQAYDPSGNLLQAADGGSYVFDAANRPVGYTAADGTVTSTEYWADGTRKLQRAGDVTTTFHWDGDTLLNETVSSGGGSADGAGTASYLIGAARHARIVRPPDTEGEQSAPLTSYYGTDRHGNVTDLTDRDGLVTTRYAYTDYGVTTAHQLRPTDDAELGIARNPFRYAGEHTDRNGTQHLATRSYDSGTLRFISMDSAALENRFAFGDLNPIMHIDPSGQTTQSDGVNWFVAVAGVVLAIASIASAVHTAGQSLHALTALSVTAVFADLGAAAAATANVVDTYDDFMDDDTANWVMLAEIALPIGAAMGAYVLGRVWTGLTRNVKTIKFRKNDVIDIDGQKYRPRDQLFENTQNVTDSYTPYPTSSSSLAQGQGADQSVSKLTTDASHLMAWAKLKRQMKLLTGSGDFVPEADTIAGLADSIADSPLFQKISGLTPGQAPVKIATGFNAPLERLSELEAIAAKTNSENLLYLNETLVGKTQSVLISMGRRSYAAPS